jgi:hypothetical protein
MKIIHLYILSRWDMPKLALKLLTQIAAALFGKHGVDSWREASEAIFTNSSRTKFVNCTDVQ